MQIIKIILLSMIFIASSSIGYVIASGYKNRVNELKEMQNALNMLKTKMRYTYETIPDIFLEIFKLSRGNVSKIFEESVNNMNYKNLSAGEAWRLAIEDSNTNFNEEDKHIITALEKLLGKTDLEGQVGEIDLTNNLIQTQIQKAELEKSKNEKLYKTLGSSIGIAIVILLI